MVVFFMFIFFITLMVMVPPPFAARLHVPILRQYTIQSNDAYQTEEACLAGIDKLLTYTGEKYPLFKFKAEVECYKSAVSRA